MMDYGENCDLSFSSSAYLLLFCPGYYTSSITLLFSTSRCAGFLVMFSVFSLFCSGLSWIGEVSYWNVSCSNFKPLLKSSADSGL